MPIRRVIAGTQPAKAGRPNTVNLEQRALDELLDELDERSGASEASKRRDFVRWPFRQTSIGLRITQAGGITSTLEVACRNLSCGGASVLHSSYLHVGTRVAIQMPKPNGAPMEIEGTICRCQHVRGVVHEIGVKFQKKIEVRDYLRSDGQTNHFSLERVDPDLLQGTVVQLDDSPMDRRLIQHYLRGTQLRLRQTDNADEAVRWIQEGCDLALIDMDLGPGKPDGMAAVVRLRDAMCACPVILLTSEIGSNFAGNVGTNRVEAFLAKPLTQELILRSIAEFLLITGGSGPMHSTLGASHPNLVLLDGFLADLRGSAAELVKAMERDEAPRCRAICSGIMGTAPAMGFAGLAAAAEAAVAVLTSSGSVRDATPALRTVLGACERVRPPNVQAA
jgi:CheY-like chemotaxis protein